MDERVESFLRDRLRAAGRTYERTRTAVQEGEAAVGDTDETLPTDEDGRAKIVCRRHATKRAVALDAEGRPACFEAGHTDCVGCVEDIEADRIETW
jgi:hypothetical protein